MKYVVSIILIMILIIFYFSIKNKKINDIKNINTMVSQSVCDEVLKDVNLKPVKEITGKPVEVNFSTNINAKMFRTEITNDVKTGPNFAGHFVISEWGCGTSCSGWAIVDLNDGKIVDYMPVNEDGNMWNYSLNTRLLVFNPKDNYGEYKNKTLEESKGGDLKSYRTYYELVEENDGHIWLNKLCTENVLDGIYKVNIDQ